MVYGMCCIPHAIIYMGNMILISFFDYNMQSVGIIRNIYMHMYTWYLKRAFLMLPYIPAKERVFFLGAGLGECLVEKSSDPKNV